MAKLHRKGAQRAIVGLAFERVLLEQLQPPLHAELAFSDDEQRIAQSFAPSSRRRALAHDDDVVEAVPADLRHLAPTVFVTALAARMDQYLSGHTPGVFAKPSLPLIRAQGG